MSAPDPISPGGSSISGDGGSGRILKKGVVVEVIYDPTLYGPEMQEKIKDTLGLKNPERLPLCPRNSCIVREFGQGKGTSRETLLVYPFFPPHICLPVKPGECVWLISPSLSSLDPQESFWISRITTGVMVDDLNYAHLPREKNTVLELPSSVTLPPYALPNFPNTVDGQPILAPPEESTVVPAENTFNLIIEESESYKNFTPQPVPKFSKRIGDLVLQGSNNTLISLGEDRGWAYTDTLLNLRGESNAVKTTDLSFAGTIDMVAGRSRYLPINPPPTEPFYTDKDNEGANPVETGFRTILNTRGYIENDKNTSVNKFTPSPAVQGDPDFRVDVARIYVSMKTSGDINFGINQDITPVAPPYLLGMPFTPGTPEAPELGVTKAIPSIPSTPSIPAGIGGATDRMATGFEAKIEPIKDAAFVIAKADEVRLIARRQDEDAANGIPEINGSIRLVKEGKQGEDLAVVVLLPDGTIQISGSKIYLGRAGSSALTPVGLPSADGGRDAGPGPGGSEPYVRYSDLKALWDSFMVDLDAFVQGCTDNKSPGYGNPNAVIATAAAAFQGQIASTHKPNISTIQSERIFGE